jgi:hypothetical protein
MTNFNIRVWLTAGILGPVLTVLSDVVFGLNQMQHQVTGIFGFTIFAVVLGLIFSIPAMILFFLIRHTLEKSSLTENVLKTILSLCSVGLIFGTLYFTFSKHISGYTFFWLLFICYSIASILAILANPLQMDNTATNSAQPPARKNSIP